MVAPKVKGRQDEAGPLAPDEVESHWRVLSGAVTQSDVFEQDHWLLSEESLVREGRRKSGKQGNQLGGCYNKPHMVAETRVQTEEVMRSG